MNYEFIGWYHDEAENSDKVWGVIELQHDVHGQASYWKWNTQSVYVTFWGRRGKKLQTKISTDYQHEKIKLIRSKESKGYNRVSIDKLNEVYPEFEKDLSKVAFWASFKV